MRGKQIKVDWFSLEYSLSLPMMEYHELLKWEDQWKYWGLEEVPLHCLSNSRMFFQIRFIIQRKCVFWKLTLKFFVSNFLVDFHPEQMNYTKKNVSYYWSKRGYLNLIELDRILIFFFGTCMFVVLVCVHDCLVLKSVTIVIYAKRKMFPICQTSFH